MKHYKHIFGPVPSRRLGISLGVDLVPMKVCTLNCAYCEVGRTTNLTIQRDEYVSYDNVINELEEYLKENPQLDYITFSGAGEPTLNSRIGDIVKYIKSKYPNYKIALLTNGTLFTSKDVRNECLGMDLILPSLDAVSDEVFRKINRPNKELNNKEIIDGLVSLHDEFNGEIWLEIFIAPRINDSPNELGLLKENIIRISPNRIQINSLDRPGIESWIEPLTKERADFIKAFLKPLEVEMVGKYKAQSKLKEKKTEVEELVLSTIKRRPCTLHDLSEISGIKVNELNKYLEHFVSKGILNQVKNERGIFFKV